MKIVLALLLVIFACDYALARSKCHMEASTSNITLSWGNFGSTIPGTVSMVRERDVNSFLCYLYSYGFGTGNANSYNRYLMNSSGDTIQYNIYQASGYNNVLVELSDVSQTSEAIWGWTLSKNVSYSNQYYLQVLADQNSTYPSGVYTDTIPVRLYSGLPFNDPVLEDIKNIQITLSIMSDISLSLVDVGSPFDPADTHQTMDFGELTTGESLEADLKVLSNSGYRVYMESENEGKLKNLTENTTIDYDLYVNGRKKRLNRRRRVAQGRNSTPTTGDNYRLRVQIGNVSGAKAGTYTDNITITAEAR
jgi:spore coat protein U-like protein